MRPNKKILFYSVIGLLALLLLIPLLLTVINWNFAKPWISERVSQATGRSFAIHGDLSFSWDRPGGTATGLARLLPWPHLRGHDLVLGNPEWATTGPVMAKAARVDFTLSPLGLLRKTITVPSLVLTESSLNLERDEQGQNNWTFKKKEEEKQPSAWQLDLQTLSFNKGSIRFVDPVKKADITTRLDSLEDGTLKWRMSGELNEEKLTGNGKAGDLLTLQDTDTTYPFEAFISVGETEITGKGTITNPRSPRALDINLKILGASMAELFPLSGLVLPETPRFSTEGRVVGSIAHDNFHLRYENFKGKVGSSDIGGTLEYLRRDPRPLLRGEVVSNYLRLRDLGALFGTTEESKAQKKDKKDKVKQPANKVLPVAPFRTERWDAIDTQVTFTGKKIIRREELPIENLSTKIQLNDGALALAPLNFGVAGGKFSTELRIEGKSEPAKARLQITARGLKLNRLFPKVESMRASLGELHINAKLSATGNSFAALAASANGEAKAFISEGTISKFILEAMGLNISSIIVTQIFGDRQVQLNCLASDFEIKNGLMQTRTFVVDTRDAIIDVRGQINLESEELGFTIRPESKGVRIISLRSPLYVQGSFKNPDVGVDKAKLGLKAGAAAVLGAVATPLASLLALINPGPEQESPCASLLAQAKEKPAAPPPGKSAKKQKAAQ